MADPRTTPSAAAPHAADPGTADPMAGGPLDTPGLGGGRARWPGIIGGLSVAFGLLGMVCYGLGLYGPGTFVSLFAATGPLRLTGPLEAHTFVQAAPMCAMAILSVLLLFAGAACTRRHPTARMLHVTWAWLKIGVSVLALAAAIAYASEWVQAVDADADEPVIGRGRYIIGVVAWFAISVVWPILILIWFNRAPVRRAVATWGTTRAA